MKKLRIVFMGTSTFAIPSLEVLLQEGFRVVGVVTAPDKKSGRGKKWQNSPVKDYALIKKLPVLQPSNLKSGLFLSELKKLNADLQVIVAFRMLPEIVWDMPELGSINLHASLLPNYRGAAPINWAIINGENETGVTTFFIDKTIDTGSIILQKKTTISPHETAGQLHDKLMIMGANLLLKTVIAIENGTINPKHQKKEGYHPTAPKIFREDCRINWKSNIDDIYNHIRGLNPYPSAWTTLNNKVIKIHSCVKEYTSHNNSFGSIQTDNKLFLKVAVNGGLLNLKEIQLEGKKKLSIKDFLAGYKVKSETMI